MTTETFINTYSDSNFDIDLFNENSYIIKIIYQAQLNNDNIKLIL